jgi:antitoxin component YwqK of YwqJK toxin-antitoxin module
MLMTVIKGGNSMKYRIEFVTNSSSSSSVITSIKTNKSEYDFEISREEPGWWNFSARNGYDSLQNYNQILDYLLNVKIGSFCDSGKDYLKISNYGGDWWFDESMFPSQCDFVDHQIKTLVDFIHYINSDVSFKIGSYDEFCKLSIWISGFGFEENEKIEALHEDCMTTYGEPEKEYDEVTQLNVVTLEEKIIYDWSRATTFILNSIEENEFYKIDSENWEEYLNFDRYGKRGFYFSGVKNDHISGINSIRRFFIEVTKALDSALLEMDIEYVSRLEEMKELDWMLSREDLFQEKELRELNLIDDIIHLMNPLISLAEEHEVDIKNIVECVNKLLMYEGDRIDGKRHGQETSYYENGIIHYQGEWKDDKYHGQGITYYENGNIRFQGDWINGNADGQGTFYYENGSKEYHGEWEDGKPNGQGTYYYNGSIDYQGQWSDGKRHGQGTSYYENGIIHYQGEWLNGKRHGHGTSYYSNGNVEYQGEWVNGKPNE